jgi:hypothetical protein
MGHLIRRPGTTAAVLAGSLGALVLAAGPAAAAQPLVIESYTATFEFDAPLCDLDVHVETQLRESLMLRVARDSDGQAFPVRSTLHVTDRVSLADDDPATNEYVTAVWKSTFVEQHVTHVEGTVYTFEGVDAGTFTLYDSSGARLFRTSGVSRFTDTFDTLGDGQPGGVYLDSVAVDRGRHLSEEETCAVIVDQLT